ncbi:MAG: hypothetical protein A3F67_08050 [Verrucomicrobia bacterium RIFCSPHIGHO2_12_FULL_41_10]|nr:MAG: hypothetical protein A3F67_08050 [Verrucomicrobia bacterium RIFCSPHIGHO2_12_FULL_41_10]
MSVTYKSTTGSTVTTGSYTVSVTPGLQLDTAIDALDKLVGVSLSRTNTAALDLNSNSNEITGVIPVIVPNSSTVATNGNITVTALPATYSEGAWVYLPAGAVVSGLAGLYWTVFSSTTAGSVKTNYVDPATTEFVPYIPTGTITTAVGSNAAYTTTTATDLPLVNITLLANSVSPGSAIKMFSRVTCPNAADAKTVTHLLGATSIGSQAFTTSTGGSLTTAAFARTLTKQILGSYGDSTIAATTYGTVNLAAASKVVIAGQLAAGTGYLVLEAFNVAQVTS